MIRNKAQGGVFEGDNGVRYDALKLSIKFGADFVQIEQEVYIYMLIFFVICL